MIWFPAHGNRDSGAVEKVPSFYWQLILHDVEPNKTNVLSVGAGLRPALFKSPPVLIFLFPGNYKRSGFISAPYLLFPSEIHVLAAMHFYYAVIRPYYLVTNRFELGVLGIVLQIYTNGFGAEFFGKRACKIEKSVSDIV